MVQFSHGKGSGSNSGVEGRAGLFALKAPLLGVALLAVTTVSALYWAMKPKPATAAEIEGIRAAFLAHTTQHRITIVSPGGSAPRTSEEYWCNGPQFLVVNVEPSADKLTHGFDGNEGFVFSDTNRGYFDSHAFGRPLENLANVLQRTRSQWMKSARAFRRDDALLRRYSCSYKGGSYECYVDEATQLPVEWVVKNTEGEPIERRLYDYPQMLDTRIFDAARDRTPGPVDYPALRAQIAAQIRSTPSQTITIGGHAITVRAILLARDATLVVWSMPPDVRRPVWLAFAGGRGATISAAEATAGRMAHAEQLLSPPVPWAIDLQPLRIVARHNSGRVAMHSRTITLEVWDRTRLPAPAGAVPDAVPQRDEVIGTATFEVRHPLVVNESFDNSSDRPHMPAMFFPDKTKPWLVEAH